MLCFAEAFTERERLENRARGEHVVNVTVLNDGVDHGELAEVGEDTGAVWEVCGGVRKAPATEVEALQLGASEDVDGEAQQIRHSPREGIEGEVPDAPGGEEPRPPVELTFVHVFIEETYGEVDGVERTWVPGEDAVQARRPILGVEVRIVEDERRRMPDAAPAGGERGGAHGVLDGEVGDDFPAEVVGEGADAVLTVVGLPGRGGEGSVHGDGAGG